MRILIYFSTTLILKHIFSFHWSKHRFYQVQKWLNKVEYHSIEYFTDLLIIWMIIINLIVIFCGFFAGFLFISATSLIILCMIFLTTDNIFLFHSLYTCYSQSWSLLIACDNFSMSLILWQHENSVDLPLPLFISPVVLDPFYLHCTNSDVAARVNCLC